MVIKDRAQRRSEKMRAIEAKGWHRRFTWLPLHDTWFGRWIWLQWIEQRYVYDVNTWDYRT